MDKKLQDALAKICASVNKGDWGGEDQAALFFLGDGEDRPIERFSSGHPALDIALGGGYPKGRFVEFYGAEATGKSTTILHAIAEHQKAYPGQRVALVDSEFSLDVSYASALGVDTDSLLVCQPEYGEQAVEIARELIRHGVGLIIFDSVAALVPKSEIDGVMTDMQPGTAARMVTKGLRLLGSEAGRAGVTVMFTNQIRMKIGVKWGNPETTTGGNALRHYMSIRVQIKRLGGDKDPATKQFINSKTKFIVVKNKCAVPYRVAEINISFGHGFDLVSGLLDTALSYGALTKRGSTIVLESPPPGEIVGRGRADALENLRKSAPMRAAVQKAVDEKVKSGVKPAAPVKATADPDDLEEADAEAVEAEAVEAADEIERSPVLKQPKGVKPPEPVTAVSEV